MGMSESSSVRDSSAAQDPASRASEQQERAPATCTFESAFAGVQTGSFNTIDELLASFQNYLLLIANRELGGGLDARFATSDIVRQTVEQARQDIGGFAGQSQEELMAWLVKILASRIAKAKGTATTDQRPVVLEPDQPLSPAPGLRQIPARSRSSVLRHLNRPASTQGVLLEISRPTRPPPARSDRLADRTFSDHPGTGPRGTRDCLPRARPDLAADDRPQGSATGNPVHPGNAGSVPARGPHGRVA